ncbi:hypothetical protein CLV92_104197 [Kineococcus xinjiangensis]|uniref:DUF4352 domain-containing protein n=1 Tax=Kineococcus xinjiangensis TaxID=512762 RepID=A0A2S6ITK1_9ACTN|nr:hypothetical protein [Kineococcus xinjiangensis]PPK97376.1 hypothetical protein CLV92_104197 [Kineococcus xinjiangensis]
MERTTRRVLAVALGLVLLASGTGCSGEEAQDAPTPPGAAGGGTTATPAQSLAQDLAVAGGSTVPVDAPAIASAPADTSGAVLEVLAVQRLRGTTLLTMAVRNESADELRIINRLGSPHLDTRSVALVDPVGLKRYLPYVDGEDRCLCSSTKSQEIPRGERTILTALYPALPEGVLTVAVQTPMGGIAEVPVS